MKCVESAESTIRCTLQHKEAGVYVPYLQSELPEDLYSDALKLEKTETDFNYNTLVASLNAIEDNVETFRDFLGEEDGDTRTGKIGKIIDIIRKWVNRVNTLEETIVKLDDITVLDDLNKTLNDIVHSDSINSITKLIDNGLATLNTVEEGQTKTQKERAYGAYDMTFGFRALALEKLRCCGYQTDSPRYVPNITACQNLYDTVDRISFSEKINDETLTADLLHDALKAAIYQDNTVPFDIMTLLLETEMHHRLVREDAFGKICIRLGR